MAETDRILVGSGHVRAVSRIAGDREDVGAVGAAADPGGVVGHGQELLVARRVAVRPEFRRWPVAPPLAQARLLLGAPHVGPREPSRRHSLVVELELDADHVVEAERRGHRPQVVNERGRHDDELVALGHDATRSVRRCRGGTARAASPRTWLPRRRGRRDAARARRCPTTRSFATSRAASSLSPRAIPAACRPNEATVRPGPPTASRYPSSVSRSVIVPSKSKAATGRLLVQSAGLLPVRHERVEPFERPLHVRLVLGG